MKISKRYKKSITLLVIVLFISITITSVKGNINAEENQSENETLTFFKEFSSPIVEDSQEYVNLFVKEANTRTTNGGNPNIPIFSKTFEFPWGTKIIELDYLFSEIKTITISKRVNAVPVFTKLDSNKVVAKNQINTEIYTSDNPYPQNWINYDTGAGINKKGEHVLFLSVHVSPVRYIPSENLIQYIDCINIKIIYEKPKITSFETNLYDLVIITTDEFQDCLNPLIEHKNNFNINTNLTTVKYINNTYPGRDTAEKIKYFLKYALDEWGISYVLLVGDINKIPIRKTYSTPWADDLLSDMYYADIYNESFNFCSWDGNDNNRFGEVEFDDSFPPTMKNVDDVDLYADVYIGRLPCTNVEEVDIVVNKIITYERMTYVNIWFKKIILAGGDTFPPNRFSEFYIYEGEITNEKVAQQLPDFKHIKLWASKRNLNGFTFHRAISKGAGFLTYAGHGVPNGWATYLPNNIGPFRRFIRPSYFSPYIDLLKNGDKLPIIFFDACLTAKLDNNFTDFQEKFPWYARALGIFKSQIYDPDALYPCFAWKFVNHEGGGAIATIGATRVAYSWVNKNGIFAGAGYLDFHFFKAYEEGVTLGKMFVQAKNDYTNNLGKDFFTMEEYLLIGDPSLRVGGYPTGGFLGEN